MSDEDRLREILSSEARSFVPAGDGLTRIQERVARRRRLRLVLVPAAALTTAAAVVAVVTLSGPVGTQQLNQDPVTPATSTPSPDRVIFDVKGPKIWPFTSMSQAQSWFTDPSAQPWAASANDVARRFATDFLELPGVTAFGDGERVSLQLGTQEIGTALLTRYGADGPWTVTGVEGGDLTITTPAAGTSITSATTVEGRISGLHENVRLQLLTSAGKELAATSAPAGQEAPWRGSLSWSDRSWSLGAIVGTTRSDRDGALTRLVAVPVSRSSQPADDPDTFVGLVDGKVLRFDGTTGQRISQLTYPPAGFADTAAAWSRDALVWVRGKQEGCDNTMYRKAGDAISTVVAGRSSIVESPQLSPSGKVLAWVQQPCTGGQPRVRIQDGDGAIRDVAVGGNLATSVLDVRDDGTLLVLTRDPERVGSGSLRVVPAGTSKLADGRSLAAASGCEWRAAAFTSKGVLAGETCGDRSRAVTLSDSGERGRVDAALPVSHYFAEISIRAGVVLVQTFSSDVDSRGIVGRYAGAQVSPFAPLPGCSAETGAGCLLQPDW